MWHVMAFAEEGYTTSSFVLHVLTDVKPQPVDVAKKAKVMSQLFCEKNMYIAYVGYEELPLRAGDSFEICVIYDHGRVQEVAGSVSPELAEKLRSYRMKFINVDYDVVPSRFHTYYARLAELGKPRVLKTRRGYHVRVALPREMLLEEILAVRESVEDDVRRIKFDREQMRVGLDYLSNLLFNEKHWHSLSWDRWESYVEEEVPPESVEVVLSFNVYALLPWLSLKTRKGIVEVEPSRYNTKVTMRGAYSEDDLKLLKETIESVVGKRDEELVEKLVRAFTAATGNALLAYTVELTTVREERDRVVVHIPDLSDAAFRKLLKAKKAVAEAIGKDVFIDRRPFNFDRLKLLEKLNEIAEVI